MLTKQKTSISFFEGKVVGFESRRIKWTKICACYCEHVLFKHDIILKYNTNTLRYFESQTFLVLTFNFCYL